VLLELVAKQNGRDIDEGGEEGGPAGNKQGEPSRHKGIKRET
jgi:hypothetical protein